jgi:hypothetical protein
MARYQVPRVPIKLNSEEKRKDNIRISVELFQIADYTSLDLSIFKAHFLKHQTFVVSAHAARAIRFDYLKICLA